MITLTAEIDVKAYNKSPFVLGRSPLGTLLFGIKMDEAQILDKRKILSVTSELKDRSDINSPSWGIISNGGSISFKDTDNLFFNFANAGVLVSGMPTRIFLLNTVTKQKRQVGFYYTGNWNYDNDNRSVTVDFKDDLEEWQDINVEGIEYDPRKPDSKPLSFFYERLYNATPKKYNMKSFSLLDLETQKILSETNVMFPMMEAGNLWSQWVKLCETCGAYIFKNKLGETVFKYAKGS